MKKMFRVRNHKRTQHFFSPVANVKEFIDTLRQHGARTMFTWREGGELRELSYEDFVDLVRDLSLGMRDRFGVSRRVVAIVADKSPYWVAAYLAVIASGYSVVPMDRELDGEEISKFFETVNVSAVVYSKSFNELFAGMISGKHKTLEYLIPLDTAATGPAKNLVPFDILLKTGGASDAEFIPDTDAERCCEYLFTSGTTGSSKCVMLCQRNVFSSVTSACASVDFNKNDVLVSVLPLHHTYELCCTLAACDFGCRICINESLRYLLKDFKDFKPTALVLVPLFVSTMYKKIMLEAKHNNKDKLLIAATFISHYLEFIGLDMSDKLFRDVRDAFGGRLQKIICGGAALNPDMIRIFESFGISLYEGYGITECSPLVAVTPYYKRRCGSVGVAVPCCEVRIEGVETNEDGYISGEIQVKGENVMLGYLNNDEANADAFTSDGWFKTGDVGYMDDAGYIYITGRSKSVIILDNGKNVFPEEIEEYLENIDMISESVVIGREEEDGTSLIAVIFPNYAKYPDMSENELRMAIQKAITAQNKRLPSFKQIHKLEFRKTEFEKTTSKKIKRHLVK